MSRLFAALLQDINGGAANPANPANPPPPISRLATLARVPSFTGELEARIRAMAGRWRWMEDELQERLEAAKENPAGWIMCLDDDERSAAKCEQAGVRFLP